MTRTIVALLSLLLAGCGPGPCECYGAGASFVVNAPDQERPCDTPDGYRPRCESGRCSS